METRGHRLIRHNYHLRFIEIDLVTISPENRLHLIEVKSWQSNLVNPLATLTSHRIKKLKRAARTILYEVRVELESGSELANEDLKQIAIRGVDDIAVSFDLIWIKAVDEIEYYESLEL